MDTMVGLSWLGQAGKQSRLQAVICTIKLTFVAGFEVGSDVGIHTRPVVTLKEALFCFIDVIMPDQQVAMCIGKSFLGE